MPASQPTSRWPSWFFLGCALARPTCFESREAREARLADYERRVDSVSSLSLQASSAAVPLTGDARLRGVWTYTVGDCDGCYLIGKHGSTMFYYEEGLICRLFGILQEESPGSESYFVVLSIGTLRIRPSSGSLISELKPWGGTDWHDAVIASRAEARRPDQPAVAFPEGSQDRLASFTAGGGGSPSSAGAGDSPGTPRSYSSFFSPLDFALAAEKVVEDDSVSPRAVDVGGKWEIFEQTSGKFDFVLKQKENGEVKGKGRSCDDPASDWSIKLHGKVEGRTLSWTEYVSKRPGREPNQEAGRMVAIMSPCGRFFGGFGATDSRQDTVPQHFAGILVRRQRDKKAEESSSSKAELNLSGKITLTKWGDEDGGDEDQGKLRKAGSFVGDAFRRTTSLGRTTSGRAASYGSFVGARSRSSGPPGETRSPRRSFIGGKPRPSPRDGEEVSLTSSSFGSYAPSDHRKRAKFARAVHGIFGGTSRQGG